MSGPLGEYHALRDKIDATVQTLSARAGDALTCAPGCAQCCAPGLSVLPVEAFALQAHMDAAPPTHIPRDGVCIFLGPDDRCAVYAARPLLCRTHGLALRTPKRDRTGTTLRVFAAPLRDGSGDAADDEVETCHLNYSARAPHAEECLDVHSVQALLTTVNARFLPHLDDAVPERIPLDALWPDGDDA